MLTLLKSAAALIKSFGWINKTLCEGLINFSRTKYKAEAVPESTRYWAFNYYWSVYLKKGMPFQYWNLLMTSFWGIINQPILPDCQFRVHTKCHTKWPLRFYFIEYQMYIIIIL